MKFICISDMHTQYEKLTLPKADVLIIAGDIGIDTDNDAIRFMDWMEKQPFTHKIVVGGNHDGGLLDDSTVDHVVAAGCVYLENEGCEIEGVKIWGSPYSPTFMDWSFMADRGEEIKKHWDKIPDDTDILITHGPPKGILDRAAPWGEELGCEELKIAVDRVQPRYHIFGHIHGSYGRWVSSTGRPKFYNASVCNEAYSVVNKPLEFEWHKLEVGEGPWDKEWDGLLKGVAAE